ncbi:AMP-binding protein [Rubripirellula sp.]|nr:AMP-binding protein [Rubripirellula sp.]MDB4634814.1 AMP-binding protein [Rubripirellula sp.]MDB4654466.1 AMP-binding protein [Rubripirellula sp.]
MSENALYEAFQHQVHSRPDAVALLLDSPSKPACKCSWHALSIVVDRVAGRIEKLGSNTPAGHCLAHMSENCDADIVLALASLKLGLTEAPIDNRIEATELLRRRNFLGGVWIDDRFKQQITSDLIEATDRSSTSESSRITLPSAVKDYQPSKLQQPAEKASLILWTSGTTSKPLAVLLSAESLHANAAAKLKAVPQEQSDIRLTMLPLSHAYARTCDFGTWLLSGCTLAVCLGYQSMLRRLQEFHPSLINTVPAIASRMLQKTPENLDKLRLLGCGGAALDPNSFMEWSVRGVTVIQGYGLTEAGPVISSATPSNAMPGLVGEPVEGWEIAIKQGQLFVRGPHLMLGYLKQPEATQTRITDEGWLATGDLVERDHKTQQLRILGRVDDVIVLASGRKIYPAAIERDIEQIDGIEHAVLHYSGSLQLWLDLDSKTDLATVETETLQVLSSQAATLHCTLHRFQPALSVEAGELTAKETIRRGNIIEKRLSDHAGS